MKCSSFQKIFLERIVHDHIIYVFIYLLLNYLMLFIKFCTDSLLTLCLYKHGLYLLIFIFF